MHFCFRQFPYPWQPIKTSSRFTKSIPKTTQIPPSWQKRLLRSLPFSFPLSWLPFTIAPLQYPGNVSSADIAASQSITLVPSIPEKRTHPAFRSVNRPSDWWQFSCWHSIRDDEMSCWSSFRHYKNETSNEPRLFGTIGMSLENSQTRRCKRFIQGTLLFSVLT
jgi:hypothetical protein